MFPGYLFTGKTVGETAEENAFSSSETCSTRLETDVSCEEYIEQHSRELHRFVDNVYSTV